MFNTGYNIYHTALVSLTPHKFVPSQLSRYRLQDIKIYAFLVVSFCIIFVSYSFEILPVGFELN